MYEQFYGFREKPFSMTPDPAFLYLGTKHSTGLSMLRYGLMNRAGITVLTGDIGAGKTTLLRHLLNESEADLVIGLISNTHESFGNLMQWVAVAFDLGTDSDSKPVLYERFASYLIEQYAAGKRTVLIVDEAQNLDDAALEELRLLTNINADKDQLLQLVLVGQPELRDKLRSPKLVQFVQRVAVDFHLAPLGPEETHHYINHRIEVAGGKPGLFGPVACRFIHYQCGGVPRLINSVCDTALVYGFAGQETEISAELVFDMVIERITGGLFGAGHIRFDGLKADTEQQMYRKAMRRARRRAATFLRRAHAEMEPEETQEPQAAADRDEAEPNKQRN
ncbi:MAG: AAA family ATPase [Gammaproteobacteria bacterium]